jgi:hypothetical protein
MSMRTSRTDVIVRLDPNEKKSRRDKPEERLVSLEDLTSFDEAAWCRLCEQAYKHTLLIDKISEQIKQNPALIDWIRTSQDIQIQDSTDAETERGKDWLPDKLVTELCDSLKSTPLFSNMSARSCISASDRVEEIFKSWFASRSKLINQIGGKRRWLSAVESDFELAKISDFSQSEIQNKAEEILAQIEAEKESAVGTNSQRIFNTLFEKINVTKDVLSQRAIIHLLKNGGKVQEELKKPGRGKSRMKPVMTMTLSERLEAKRVEIERLEKQLLSQLPRARNLFPDQAFEESLESLLALPDPDLAKHDQYYFLVFLLLIQHLGSKKYIQFEQHLLKAMELQWGKTESLLYYQILIYSFLLCATSAQKYLQLSHYLTQAIKAEVERVDSQFFNWHESITFKIQDFLRQPKSLPYPISFGCDDVRAWELNAAGKIFFKLNGWAGLIFEVRCHRRQLSLIKTFFKDWHTWNNRENKGEYSGSLMLLRSIELIWVLKKPSPEQSVTQLCLDCETFQQDLGSVFWNECKLTIGWTFDSDALTKQGSEKIRHRKLKPQLEGLQKKQETLKQNQDRLRELEALPESSRSKAQTKEIKKLKKKIEDLEADIIKPRPKLACLQSARLFDRPDRPLYEGIPNIFVGALLDLDKHLVVTIVDAMRQKVLTLRNAHSISAEGYSLLQRYFQQRKKHSAQRQKDQIAHRHIQQTESGLGQQVARLFAKGLVKLAQEYKASTIVIPETDGWRERLYSQLVARAKIKCNGCKKAMARYIKEHGQRLHQWDYSRLSKAIVDCAATKGIEVIQHKTEFEADVFRQAANLAIAAYDSLNSVKP